MTQRQVARCPWPGIDDPEYARYHDEEWGVPLTDDRALFEKLVLEGFQSGLSWLTILRKRENFRKAFDSFEPGAIALYGKADIERLMSDSGIVRNRAKIEATIGNAKAFLKLADAGGLSAFVWSFAPAFDNAAAAPATLSDVPARTDASARMSKALKKCGFRFVGPTTAYAFMQSTGMINDHLKTCHRRAECIRAQRTLLRPAQE